MLDHGHVLMELLKQPLYHPLPLWKQVCLLAVTSERLLDDIPLKEVRPFADSLLSHLQTQEAALIQKIQSTGKLEEEDRAALLATATAYKKQVK
jgi:F-type H+-transporting ATPase subunit alpha